MNEATQEQPAPVANDRPAVWDLVIADMRQRDRVGRERYGTPLQPHNGRDALVDAYQEALDLAVYLRQELQERRSYQQQIADLKAANESLQKTVDLLRAERDKAREALAASREQAQKLFRQLGGAA